jgi:hypothetical protein
LYRIKVESIVAEQHGWHIPHAVVEVIALLEHLLDDVAATIEITRELIVSKLA